MIVFLCYCSTINIVLEYYYCCIFHLLEALDCKSLCDRTFVTLIFM